MDKTDLKRQQLLGKIADHLLASGIEQSSLRQLAAAIGTSDRMLLHYFEDKEALMRAALTLVATRMIGLLDSVRSGQVPYQTLLIQHIHLDSVNRQRTADDLFRFAKIGFAQGSQPHLQFI